MVAECIVVIDRVLDQPLVLPAGIFAQLVIGVLGGGTEYVRNRIVVVAACIFVDTDVEFIFKPFQTEVSPRWKPLPPPLKRGRSEERRVGKEC